jgi:RNA polymerase sigma-70 factor (ECF subfamily)
MTHEQHCVRRFCESGDEEAFRELYRLHAPVLYRMSCRMLGLSAEAAQDVVQETWLRAARALPEFRWESTLSTWLTGIAINRCRELLRQSRRTYGMAGGADADELPAPAVPAGMRLDLEQAIGRLAEACREVLLLHDVEGYTHGEIATMLGIASGTSKSQLSRARRLLRQMLRPALADAAEGKDHDR